VQLPPTIARLRPLRPLRWLAVLLVLVGCSCCPCCSVPIGPSPGLTNGDLPGTYAGPGGGTITLRADGTFTATGLTPVECRDPYDTSAEGPAGGDGQWTLHKPETLNPYQDLDLDFTALREGWSGWLASRNEIAYFIGDPDEGRLCRFTRSAGS